MQLKIPVMDFIVTEYRYIGGKISIYRENLYGRLQRCWYTERTP